MQWIRQHFQRYREREPWDFCWRITTECVIITLLASIALDLFGFGERDLDLSYPVLLLVAVFIAPLLETLIFQALPVWIARLCKARLSVQVAASVVPFFAAHALEGIGTGIAAGLLVGFYLAFTYAHWRERRRWTAFWTTAVCHALHNTVFVHVALATGEI